jgi:hypothetical protein
MKVFKVTNFTNVHSYQISLKSESSFASRLSQFVDWCFIPFVRYGTLKCVSVSLVTLKLCVYVASMYASEHHVDVISTIFFGLFRTLSINESFTLA